MRGFSFLDKIKLTLKISNFNKSDQLILYVSVVACGSMCQEWGILIYV